MRDNKMKLWAKISSALMFLLCGWFSVPTANAASCSINNDIYVTTSGMFFNIPSYGVATGNPVGGWWQVSAPLVGGCSEPIYSITAFGYSNYAGMTYSDGGVTYNVYNTGTPGIGFIAAISDSISGVFYPMPNRDDAINYVYTTPWANTPHGTSVSATVKVRFITTALLSPGVYTIPSLTLMGVNASGVVRNGIIGQGFTRVNPFNVSVIANTCSVDVNSRNQSVTLADVTYNDLPYVGATAKDKTFNVSMNCQSQVYVYAQLNGSQSAETSADGVLQLSNPLMAGTARGVGIQILNNGIPMPIGTNMPAQYTSGGGLVNIPFSARYYRTQSNMTAGTANATATLNINYR